MASLVRVWPQSYKIVLILTLLLLASAVALQIFFIGPLADQEEVCQEEYEEAKGKVKASEWDSSETGIANAMKMYALAIGSKRDPGVRKHSEDLLAASGHRLQKLIDEVKHATRNDYLQTSGKMTYSHKYDALKKEFRSPEKQGSSANIELIPAVYGMGRASEGNYYNMTLKLLLTEEVVSLLQKHHLQVMRTDKLYLPETDQVIIDPRERANQRRIPASDLRVLPVRNYILKKGESPFLLEVSLTARVTGSMKDFAAFVSALPEEGRHFAVTHLELQTAKPRKDASSRESRLISSQENGKEVRIDQVVAIFTCSGFALPETDLSKPVAKRKKAPRSVPSSQTVSEKPMGI